MGLAHTTGILNGHSTGGSGTVVFSDWIKAEVSDIWSAIHSLSIWETIYNQARYFLLVIQYQLPFGMKCNCQ